MTLNAGRPGIGEAERSVRFARAVSAALSVASNLPIDDAAVAGLIDPDRWPSDALFARAWRETLAALSPKERVGRLGGVTGHIGESVVEVILEEIGYSMLWHFTGPFAGGHGVDLLVLSPDGNVLAVEVKATLRAGRWPRPLMPLTEIPQSCSTKFPTWWHCQDRAWRVPVVVRRSVSLRAW